MRLKQNKKTTIKWAVRIFDPVKKEKLCKWLKFRAKSSFFNWSRQTILSNFDKIHTNLLKYMICTYSSRCITQENLSLWCVEGSYPRFEDRFCCRHCCFVGLELEAPLRSSVYHPHRTLYTWLCQPHVLCGPLLSSWKFRSYLSTDSPKQMVT